MKKIIALFLALSMLFALTACGGNNENTPTDESTGATTSATESTNTTMGGTEDSTQSTTEGTTGGDTTNTTQQPTTTPPTTTPPTTTPPTTPPTTEAPHTHSYSSKVTTAATCGKEGVKTFTCSCGHSYTEKIAATGQHSWQSATCTNPKTCNNCGKTEGTTSNHNYDNNGTCTKCSTVLPEATEYITFHDVFLENYVKQSLGIQGTNKVSKYAMSKLTSFDIDENVTDVQDLKYATNLQSISINADNVKNLNVLCSLSKITSVSFGFWKKIDITFMKDMNNVERIYFNNSEIVGGNISYLISSPKLKDLFYYNPSGSGIDFLQGANALESLELWHAFGGNSDISVLKTLPKLKTLEILTYNSTSDAQRAVYAELMSKGVSVRFI